jgi:hypothetical protein
VSEDQVAATKKPRGMDVVVMRELRRARKLYRDDESSSEASFIVATANVLALVDLAAAIRETGGIASEAQAD